MASMLLTIISRLAAVIAGIVLFGLSFKLGLFGGVEVLFYRGIVIAFVALIIQAVFLAPLVHPGWQKTKTKLSWNDLVTVCALAFAFNITFLIVFPVTIDRSVSMFLLYEIEQHPEAVTGEELESKLISEYVQKNGAVKRRIEEQVVSGNLEADSRGFKLTKQGSSFLKFSRFVAWLFNLKTQGSKQSE